MMLHQRIVYVLIVGVVCFGLVQKCEADSVPYYSSNPSTTTDDAQFKALAQVWARAINVVTETALEHPGTPIANSSGFYLSVVLSIFQDKVRFTQAVDPNSVPLTGAECLALNGVLARDFNNALLHRNDPIVGNITGLPLQGEQLYQQQLQNFGLGLNGFLTAAAANKDVQYPGKWLSVVLTFAKNIAASQLVIDTNDTSPNCLAVTRRLGADALAILSSLNIGDDLDGEAQFKAVLQALATDLTVLQKTADDHIGTPISNSSGFFLSVVLSLNQDYLIFAQQAFNDTATPITGAQCVAVHAMLGQDFAQAIAHRNDAILGQATGLPLQGEQLYQQQLQSLGTNLNVFFAIAAANKNVPNPGKWLSMILDSARDFAASQVIVSTNDTSPNCLTVMKRIGAEVVGIVSSLLE
ncbi:hypothetical protein BV898_00463 [Hypsibius exemplaris]|uniref:Uncharacterized protein n=1 Tax=Hypsibius exemplaris TaxID=2072580 RepID=A0A1W0XDI1_HYPEX|nr:hypothetical protein BV898_00463 [Hypsibius exemplaris]